MRGIHSTRPALARRKPHATHTGGEVIDERGLARRIRIRILEAAFSASKGHIGSALSIADIVAAVAPRVRGLGTGDAGRDRFVLSKGHAAMAWYGALRELDVINDDVFGSYGKDNTLLGTHPDPELPGVDFQTGSLGQGLAYAVGSAMASRRSAEPWLVFAVLSDSELDEGVTWEAALSAAHNRCAELTVVLDLNGQQALGFTKDVLDTSAAPGALRAMGWHVSEVDGHDVDSLAEALSLSPADRVGKPHLIVAKTTAGKGVDFMEQKIEWHYLPMTADQYRSALVQLGENPGA